MTFDNQSNENAVYVKKTKEINEKMKKLFQRRLVSNRKRKTKTISLSRRSIKMCETD